MEAIKNGKNQSPVAKKADGDSPEIWVKNRPCKNEKVNRFEALREVDYGAFSIINSDKDALMLVITSF